MRCGGPYSGPSYPRSTVDELNTRDPPSTSPGFSKDAHAGLSNLLDLLAFACESFSLPFFRLPPPSDTALSAKHAGKHSDASLHTRGFMIVWFLAPVICYRYNLLTRGAGVHPKM